METEFLTIESLDIPVRVIKQDLTNNYEADESAAMLMDVLKEKVSPELWDLLYQMLLPFADAMQLEMASDMLEFADFYHIYTTGSPSADAVLEVCYRWIAEERGLDEFAEKIKLYKF